jgi:hypothetical protein
MVVLLLVVELVGTYSGFLLLFGSRITQIADLWFEPLVSGRVTSKNPSPGKTLALVPVFSSNEHGFQILAVF